ncbi:hypothetical protein N0B31_00520 [Salinirubellus salinus]|uniref:Uncharacterized protein n=1 Tax=Salinirubellus salinus TaxID=1364945 RepID=A0A9E7R3I4_9EURY|nr:hypothetical protein [Salinirubellus salinus]UWM54778.1 hypothetical protein N0B31_00520 [Salinirubellus salinus]
MGELSRDRVTETLERLQERYSSFDVQQTSVGVPSEVYERAVDGGVLDASVRVRNEAGEVLVAESEDHEETPRVRYDPASDPAAELERALLAETGVGCRIEDLLDVSIVAVHDEDDEDRDPAYLLEASFEGRYEDGTPGERLAWRDEVEETSLA